MNYENLKVNVSETPTNSHAESKIGYSELETLLLFIMNNDSIPWQYQLTAKMEHERILKRRENARIAREKERNVIIDEIICIIKNAPSNLVFTYDSLICFLNNSHDFHNFNTYPTKKRKSYATLTMIKTAIETMIKNDIIIEKVGYIPNTSKK